MLSYGTNSATTVVNRVKAISAHVTMAYSVRSHNSSVRRQRAKPETEIPDRLQQLRAWRVAPSRKQLE